ncbi:MAG: TrbG/VirB9 family P-type conjugative transfer protein [Spirochaetaceae bacterium]|jgi:type IV secretion system protein VirB9|nr:TrbG/VirB9 family P-type conjugative transfer protein [Spirochaetaceae bacterium]
MKPIIIFSVLAFTLSVLPSCRTVHFDVTVRGEPFEQSEQARSLKEEEARNERELEEIAVEEELKEVDVEKTVVYVDRPVYSPERQEEAPRPTGAAAVQESTKAAIQVPLKYVNGMMYYPWDETFVYEIHTMPYRTTDIQLEPGEQVLEMPFLSEEKVWELGAGVSRKDGQDVQHFFVKPTYANLTTSMIIITDRRVYHILLKSFKDTFMVMVQWEYPSSMPFTVKAEAMNKRIRELANDALTVNPEFLSFDYKISYSLFKKPVWIPRRVYDDGRKTYIELDEKMLHTESPVIFNKRNERINYRVKKNLVIIDELIEKITIRRGKEKITITKKKYKTPVAMVEQESAVTPEQQQGE